MNWWEYLPADAYRSWQQERRRPQPPPAVPSWAPGAGIGGAAPPATPRPPMPPLPGGGPTLGIPLHGVAPMPGLEQVEAQRRLQEWRAQQQPPVLPPLRLSMANPELLRAIVPDWQPAGEGPGYALGDAMSWLLGLGQEYVGKPVAGGVASVLNEPEARANVLNALSYSLGGSPGPGWRPPFRAEELAPARPELEFRPEARTSALQQAAAAYEEAKRIERARPEAFAGEKGWTEGLLLNPAALLVGGLVPPGSLQVVGPSMPALAAYERAAQAVEAGTATEAQQRLAEAVPAVMGPRGEVTSPQAAAQVESLVREAQAAARAANPRFWPTTGERAASRAEKVAQRRAYLRQVLGREPTAEELARGVAPGAGIGGETPPLPSWAPAGERALAPRLGLPAPGGAGYTPAGVATLAQRGAGQVAATEAAPQPVAERARSSQPAQPAANPPRLRTGEEAQAEPWRLTRERLRAQLQRKGQRRLTETPPRLHERVTSLDELQETLAWARDRGMPVYLRRTGNIRRDIVRGRSLNHATGRYEAGISVNEVDPVAHNTLANTAEIYSSHAVYSPGADASASRSYLLTGEPTGSRGADGEPLLRGRSMRVVAEIDPRVQIEADLYRDVAYARRQPKEPWLAHRRAVRQALAEGSEVPAEVLAEYPELAAEAPTREYALEVPGVELVGPEEAPGAGAGEGPRDVTPQEPASMVGAVPAPGGAPVDAWLTFEGPAPAAAAAPGAGQREASEMEAGLLEDLASQRAALDAATSAGDTQRGLETRHALDLTLRQLALERSMNDVLWRHTGKLPAEATAADWRRALVGMEDDMRRATSGGRGAVSQYQAQRLRQTAQGIRAVHLGEAMAAPVVEPDVADLGRWLPERPLTPQMTEAVAAPGYGGAPKPLPTPEEAGLPTEWLTRLPDDETLLERTYRGGPVSQGLRALGQRYDWVEALTSSAGLPEDEPWKRAVLLHANVRGIGEAAVKGLMGELRQLGTARELFDVDDNGMAHMPSRSPVAIGDLLEHPRGYRLTPQQEEFIRVGRQIIDTMNGLALTEGIRLPMREYPQGAHYWPRKALGRLDPASNTIEPGVIGRGPEAGGGTLLAPAGDEWDARPEEIYGLQFGKKQGYELQRGFASEAAGRARGLVYATPEDALEAYVRGVYRQIADKRLVGYALEHLQARELPTWQDLAGGEHTGRPWFSEARLPGPAFERWAFAKETIGRARQDLGEEIPGAGPVAGAVKALEHGARAVSGFNALSRQLTTTLDLGGAMTTLLPLAYSHPIAWWQTVSRSMRGLRRPDTVHGYFAANREAVMDAAAHGVSYSRSEFGEGLPVLQGMQLARQRAREAGARGFEEAIVAAWSAIGQVGERVLRPAEALYESQMAIARTELWKSLRRLAGDDEARLVDVARHVNSMTGVVDTTRLGVSQRQRTIEAGVLFAPRLLRSVAAVFYQAQNSPFAARLFAEDLARFLFGAAVAYTAICTALGQKPQLDPRKSRFFGFRLPYVDVWLSNVGGAMWSAFSLLARLAAAPFPTEQQRDEGTLQRAGDYAGSFLRGKLSPVVSTGVDILSRTDWSGAPLDVKNPWVLTKRVLADNGLPFWLMSTLENGGNPAQRIALGAAELAGLRASAVSPAERRNDLRERYAREEYGADWAALDRGQKYDLVQGHPDLEQANQRALRVNAERGELWAQLDLDVEAARRPLEERVTALGGELRAGRLSGNDYRDELSRIEVQMAQIRDTLAASKAYQGLREGAPPPSTAPLDRYLDRYYRASEAAKDPRTGRVDMELRAQLLDLLERETPADVLARAREYLDRNRDPEYAVAQEQWREYMRIPKYLGLSVEEGRRADHAAEMIAAIRAQLPGMPYNSALALYAQQDAEGALLAKAAERLRNPARRIYYAQHPALARFYGDLTWQELSAVQLPELLEAVGQ